MDLKALCPCPPPGITKTMRVMKITAVILLSCCLTVSARTFSQVNLSEKNAPIQKVFKQIQKQTGFYFVYPFSLLDGAGTVSVELKNASLQQAVEACLEGKPLSYEIVDKTVVIKKRDEPIVTSPVAASVPPTDITGRITDKEGRPLEGASITVKGSKNGASTDANGMFSLKGANPTDEITVSYTGYTAQTLKLGNRTSLVLALEVSNSVLDQVQVIAYGKQSQRYATNSVAVVDAKTIEQQPVSNPLLALQGQVAGLQVVQSTGLPGAGVSVQIRGRNSIYQGVDPLYIVDGVPYVSQLLPSITGILGVSLSGAVGNAGNPFSYLSPNDIESVSILKDADATAIYGSRAANGAVLITTKRGHSGQTKVNINLQSGFGKVQRLMNLMNTQQYLAMRHEALTNDGLVPDQYTYDINGVWDTTRSADWQKELIGGTSHYTDLNASVSGGTVNINYMVGTTYHRETTVFPGNTSFQTGSVHFNLGAFSNNRKFEVQLSGNYLIANNHLPQVDLTNTAVSLPPNSPKLYNPDGSLNWALDASGNATWDNPLAPLNRPYENRTNNLISNMVVKYHLLKGLSLETSLGYTNLQQNETIKNPKASYSPAGRAAGQQSNVTYGNNSINSWIVEPQARYERRIASGELEILAGMTISQNNSNGLQLYTSGYASDALITDIRSATSISILNSNNAIYKYNAGFGRVKYNWLKKYILDFTIRRDGSSRFGPEDRFHNFMAIGSGWIFSEANFIKNALPILSYGKLWASYGTTGNDQIGDYNYLNTYRSSSVGIAYQGGNSLRATSLFNPHLHWELTKKFDIGLDLGLLNDRILVKTDFYLTRSSSPLLTYNLPIITGFTGITDNFPATFQNSGIEFSVSSNNIKNKNFTWSTSFNLTIPVDNMKLISFPGLEESSFASSYAIGRSISNVEYFHSLGVDPLSGVYVFSDSHGNPTSSPDYFADRSVLISTDPKYYGGLTNTFSYKGFELSFLFQFSKRISPLNSAGFAIAGLQNQNEPTYMLNHWQKAGDYTTHQLYSTSFALYNGINNLLISDAAFGDGSYIKLRNINLSYQLPQQWINKVHLQGVQLYLQGQNIFTLSKNKELLGFDPETVTPYSLPPLRVITAGIRIGL